MLKDYSIYTTKGFVFENMLHFFYDFCIIHCQSLICNIIWKRLFGSTCLVYLNWQIIMTVRNINFNIISAVINREIMIITLYVKIYTIKKKIKIYTIIPH